ncbi:MAG: hypothetical protein PWQ57_561 [Desulfovibrionales bacterium]|nr:hypothetical protein [Desulfovibrionales bacterium]
MSRRDQWSWPYDDHHAPPIREPGGRLPVALVHPGPARLAISTLGWQAVYRLLAPQPGLAVERFFLERAQGPAKSEDSGRTLASFPVIAFSAGFEEDLQAIVGMMLDAGVPPTSTERPHFPFILAGGPLAFLNPAPLSPFVDAFWVGEAEAGLQQLILRLRDLFLEGADKTQLLDAAVHFPNVYVPGRSSAPVARAASPDLTDPAFSCFVSSQAEFRDTLLLEINRGCPYGCRFCAAGYIYRPPRTTSLERAKAIVEQANPVKVGLIGTALTDWPPLMDFLRWLAERKCAFTLSSLRADGLTDDLVAFLRRRGVRTVTLALEGPSRRLRNAARKNLEEADLLAAVRRCAVYGVNHLKLYLIVGWPGETDADYDELDGFLGEITNARDQGLGNRKKQYMRITLSASCLCPKPHTPLQWAPMASEEMLKKRLAQVKTMVKRHKGLALLPDNPGRARLQGYLARSGPEAAPLVLEAARSGSWRKALKHCGVDEASVLDRERDEEEAFPWEAVDPGANRNLLRREWLRYKQAAGLP